MLHRYGLVPIAAVAILLPGCLATDAESVSLTEQAIVEGSPDAVRALRVANTLSRALLLSVPMNTLAADSILARRVGADGVHGTADDRPFYTIAALDAVPGVGLATLDQLAAYGRLHPELLGGGFRIGALPPAVAADPNAAGLLGAIAVDSSLMIDGDTSTVLPSEWELALLFAHHFEQTTAARLAPLRSHVFASDIRRGPFIDIANLNRTVFGEGQPSWALGELLSQTAADPRHTVGRIYAPELEAMLANPSFVALFPGIQLVKQQYLDIWNARIEVTNPGNLPIGLARVRALLASRGFATFNGAYPTDRPMPAAIAATPFRMPFLPGTEIVCMQGNNSMGSPASHAPDQLRYALDLDAPFATKVVASASGTAYVYDHARPNSFDNFGFGNILLIDLHNGYALLHAHISTFTVVNGQSVTAGQVVAAVGNTGAAGSMPHVHFQVVPLFRTPDPANEEYHSDVPIGRNTPFGSPEPFTMRAIDLTAGATAPSVIPSSNFVCGESGRLPGAAHIYRTP